MDDLQGRPSDRERDALSARIRQVADQGRIGATDRDIRLGNVRSAQSRAELELMSRDLDQLEASVGGTTGPAAAPQQPAAPYQKFSPDQVRPALLRRPSVGSAARRPTTLVAIVIAVVALACGGGLSFFAIVGHVVSSASRAVTHSTSTPSPVIPTVDADTGPDVPGGYTLSVAGLRSWRATYVRKFATASAVDLVLYGDYAVVDVPSDRPGMQEGWVYREGSGWTRFGGPRAVFPGAKAVDLRALDVVALMRNVRRARTTLGVAHPTTTYAIVRSVPQVAPEPRVDIHVSDGAGGSGYLSTKLDGTVVRAYRAGQ